MTHETFVVGPLSLNFDAGETKGTTNTVTIDTGNTVLVSEHQSGMNSLQNMAC